MAELYLIGQIINATNFEESNLFCKWSIQFGSNWKNIEGEIEGTTQTSRGRIEQISTFCHPIDVHLITRGINGWPKLHVEIFTVNGLNKCWPVGFGFAHIPTQPGLHNFEIVTWKIAPNSFFDSLSDRFNTDGFTVCKSDLVFSGIERYKLSTRSSGKINVQLMIICKDFRKFGVEL